ncbi:MAG TPA: 4-nitrotryptophan synthase [Pyrinomonadaceae bacterium]|nr:4-nitrotryptophan synthase [Pyrinomonadaceae bacterium]
MKVIEVLQPVATGSPLSDPNIVSNPYPVYAELAEKDPIHWCEGLQAWAVMRHADCLKALTDPRLKAERMESVLGVKFPGNDLPPDSIYHRFTKNVMMYTDPPVHDSLRKSTNPGFTRAAHEHYSKLIEEVANDLVATIPQGKTEIDGVADLGLKLPVNAAVRAFGLPEEDLDFVLPRVNDIMTYWSGPQEQPLGINFLLDRLDDLHTYAVELVEGKRGKVPPDTVIHRLAACQATNVDSTLQQTIHQLVLLVIALFAPTTPGSASSGMFSFATNTDQIDRFRADAACAANAANEVFRYNASNQFTWRLAGESFNLNGVRIEQGQAVVTFLGAANRDPEVFEDPNKFNLDRKNSAQHLTFGAGVHNCLGRQIASLEIGWFFAALFRRYQRIELAGEPVWNSNLEFRSLKSLPLRLTAA